MGIGTNWKQYQSYKFKQAFTGQIIHCYRFHLSKLFEKLQQFVL